MKKALASASAFFNNVFRKRNVIFPSEVMCALRVKCTFGTWKGTHHITATVGSNITMRSMHHFGVAKTSLNFFICVRRAQHHLTEGQHHFERSENIIPHSLGTNERCCADKTQMMCFAMMWAYARWCCASRKWKVAFLYKTTLFHHCTFPPSFWTWRHDFV